jgi:ABC-type nitrate/sulfonate/bicarbonate transport system permease component
MSALGAYLLATGGYVLGAVLLAVGVGVVVAVSILHFRAIKKMKKMLADIQNLEVKK